MSYPQDFFDSLPPEIIVMVMKYLPTFYDLNSLTRTSSIFNLIFKSNEYVICDRISRLQFVGIWSEIDSLLQHQKRNTDIRLAGQHLQGSSGMDNSKKSTTKRSCQGFLGGGMRVGIAEATRLLRFTQRCLEWRKSVTDLIYPDSPVPNIRTVMTGQATRIDRAIFRYYFLLQACVPEWIEERKKYQYMFRRYNIFSDRIEAQEEEERKEMTQEEILERKRHRIKPFLQHSGQDLKDIYMIFEATKDLDLEIPGGFDQENWSELDDKCVLFEAEAHIKCVWRSAGMPLGDLLDPEVSFYEV